LGILNDAARSLPDFSTATNSSPPRSCWCAARRLARAHHPAGGAGGALPR